VLHDAALGVQKGRRNVRSGREVCVTQRGRKRRRTRAATEGGGKKKGGLLYLKPKISSLHPGRGHSLKRSRAYPREKTQLMMRGVFSENSCPSRPRCRRSPSFRSGGKIVIRNAVGREACRWLRRALTKELFCKKEKRWVRYRTRRQRGREKSSRGSRRAKKEQPRRRRGEKF